MFLVERRECDAVHCISQVRAAMDGPEADEIDDLEKLLEEAVCAGVRFI